MARHALGALCLALMLASCAESTDLVVGEAGGALSSGSCLETLTSSGFSFQFCVDYTGLTADQVAAIQMVCQPGADAGPSVMVAATYSDGACSRAGVVGGCQITSGGFMETIWWLASTGTTEMQFRDQCTAQHGTWVTP